MILLIISCKEKCNSIEHFSFPTDIENMSKIKQKCNEDYKLIGKEFILEYNDKNYTLYHYNEKIKILIDKKENLIFCIKTNEAYNFSIIHNVNDNIVYGINQIFLLDESLFPLYALDEYGIYQYYNDKKNKVIKYTSISNTNINFTKLKYEDIVNSFRNIDYLEHKGLKYYEIPYYKYPFAWEY